MPPAIIIAAIGGLFLGWLFQLVVSRRQRRAHLRETNAQMKQMGEIRDRYLATANMVHRDALLALERGDVEAAKEGLVFSVANFYHNFGRGVREMASLGITVGPPDFVADEIRAVERDAATSQTLRQALKRSAEPGASPNGGPALGFGNSEAGGGPPSVS
jgi:hypothetical protein